MHNAAFYVSPIWRWLLKREEWQYAECYIVTMNIVPVYTFFLVYIKYMMYNMQYLMSHHWRWPSQKREERICCRIVAAYRRFPGLPQWVRPSLRRRSCAGMRIPSDGTSAHDTDHTTDTRSSSICMCLAYE